MIGPKFWALVFKQLWRARLRSSMTIIGVALAMFLFAGIQAMQEGVERATKVKADDTTLIVYRKDRYCPFTSLIPQSYEQKIRDMEGVASVVPMKIVVSNCRTSLDVVTFRGVPRDEFIDGLGADFTLVSGSLDDWKRRSDAALLGETLASRRGLRVGDRFNAAGITAYVAGIMQSSEPQHQNVAYVHLDFLQFASGGRSGGIVTQFMVNVTDSSRLTDVARSIDDMFASAQEPTATSPEKAFVGRAAADIVEIVSFMQILGWGCLGAVLALVANAIVLSVQDRIREHAILQTLGFRSGRIARLIITEGMVLSIAGALVGSTLAAVFLAYSSLALSVEGFSLPIHATAESFAVGMLMAVGLGVLAGVVPAWQASRRDIVSCFRAV